MWRSLCLSLLLAVVTACAAQATPPQVVGVREVLFGATDSHIFLLRSIEDNMGRHGIIQTDVLLIARNRTTNTDDEVWPLARSIDHGAYFTDYGQQARVEVLPLAGAVNPFEIAASQGVRLMLGRIVDTAAAGGFSVSDQADAMVVADGGTGRQYRMGFDNLNRHITESLHRTRDALPAHFNEGGVDVLRDVSFDPKIDCSVGGVDGLSDGAGQDGVLVQISCQNDLTMAPVSVYLVVPPQD